MGGTFAHHEIAIDFITWLFLNLKVKKAMNSLISLLSTRPAKSLIFKLLFAVFVAPKFAQVGSCFKSLT